MIVTGRQRRSESDEGRNRIERPPSIRYNILDCVRQKDE